MSDARAIDVLVVGAGPAGIAASVAAAESAARVMLIDDGVRPGGQIWRDPAGSPGPQARRWLDRLARSDVEFRGQTQIVDLPEPHLALAESPDGPTAISWSKLILAVGARELFLTFPGWTLPGVVGAGALQALVKSGVDIRDRRIVVAGSGPLLLVAAAAALDAGADVALVAEQAPASAVTPFAAGLWRTPGKLVEAVRLRLRLAHVAIRTGTWPARAGGEAHVREVELTDGRRRWTERCDMLACGFGLVPQLELPMLAGCEIKDGAAQVDAWQQTSVKDIYCAGEATGVGGAEKALEEGLIAGFAAAGRAEQARSRFVGRARARWFADHLARTFALRRELASLAEHDTIVCRCEDITAGDLAGIGSWREARILRRCGMGACQGRVCGAATRVLFGFGPDSVRPPVLPARIETLAAVAGALQHMDESEHTA
jgi:NADPH-dependent 2,4-dienoyl-CoA reductase/sulfur reductase-like enzyme